MLRRMMKTAVSLTMGVFLLSTTFTETALGREQSIFNQTPQTIERYFGRYWTRLTRKDEQGNTVVTYTYNPNRLRRVFPESKGLKFYIVFVNNRVRSLHAEDMSTYLNRFPSRIDSLYAAILGYRPSTTNPVYRRLLSDSSGGAGTLQSTVYCMDDGIALGYEWLSTQELGTSAVITPDSRCAANVSVPSR